MLSYKLSEKQNKTQTNFCDEVWVACPLCDQQAITKIAKDQKTVRLCCSSCHLVRIKTIKFNILRFIKKESRPAHKYFNAELWLRKEFKNEIFLAYNLDHLTFIENYINTQLIANTEADNRDVLQELPYFYRDPQNKNALLQIIHQLKIK